MHIIKIGDDYSKEIASKWNELTAKQLLFVAKIMSKNIKKKSATVAILQNFMEIPWKTLYKIKPEVFIDLEECVDFIFHKSSLTINHFKEIKIKGQAFFGPENALTNFTFEQFAYYSENALIRIKDKPEYFIDYLISCLYTTTKNKFDPEAIEQNTQKLKLIKPELKNAILFFYIGSRNLIMKKFPKVFPKSKEGEQKPKQQDEFEFHKLVNSMNSNDMTKNPAIRQSNLYEALLYLSQQQQT